MGYFTELHDREARTVNPKPDDEIIDYVSTFNPRNSEKEQIKILERDIHMKDVPGRFKFIKSKRQENN